MGLDDWLNIPFLDDSFPLPLDAPFSARQARAEGIPRRWLAALVESGHLRHPIRGCFVPMQLADNTSTRIACLRLVSPSDAVIVDRHAGWAQGANMLLRPNEHLHAQPIAMYLPSGRGRLRNKLSESGERTFAREDIIEVDGVHMTTPLRTALDLGRNRWPETALTALDALHRLGTFTVPELVEQTKRFKGMRWVTTLRLVAPFTDGRSQSGGESVVRWRWLGLAVPPPEPQVPVVSGSNVAFIDVGHRQLRFGVEFNGVEWHTGAENEAQDAARFDWLRQDADWILEPVWTPDVYGSGDRLDRLIMEGVARARARNPKLA